MDVGRLPCSCDGFFYVLSEVFPVCFFVVGVGSSVLCETEIGFGVVCCFDW